MTVIDKLATALNRRDEVPNQELAKKIADKGDIKAVEELVENLANSNKNIQSDCIKVLYEIGQLKPALLSPYAKHFIALLDSKNNRLQWGAMTTLNSITNEAPAIVYGALKKLSTIAEKGSVITKDNYVAILIKLCAIKKYTDNAFALLREQLMASPVNQLPMYAENALPVVSEAHKGSFIKTLTSRLPDFEEGPKRKRIEKTLKKLQSK